MPKPTVVPTWATDETNNTAPTAGQQATGWLTNQLAVSSYFNWLFFWLGEWITYLDAGTWDGDLHVDGNLSASGTLDIAGDATANDYLYTTTQTILIPASAAEPVDKVNYSLDLGCWFPGTSTQRLYFPITVRVGDRIVGWRLFVRHGSGAGTITARMYLMDCFGSSSTETPLGTADTYTGADTGGTFTLDNSGLTVDVTGSLSYYVAFTGGGTIGDAVYHLEVDVQRL